LTLLTQGVIIRGVIKSFRCRETEELHARGRVRRVANISQVACRKLRQLEVAARLDELRVPPGNHLEALKGDRAGQHSMCIHDQWRVCFRWTAGGAEDVEITDYH
jgi:proteic killer suppression protein